MKHKLTFVLLPFILTGALTSCKGGQSDSVTSDSTPKKTITTYALPKENEVEKITYWSLLTGFYKNNEDKDSWFDYNDKKEWFYSKAQAVMNVKREMTYFPASEMMGWADSGLFQVVYKDGHTLDFQPYDSKDNISYLRVSYYTDPEDAVYYDLKAEDDNLKELVHFRSTLYKYLKQYSADHDLLVSSQY